MIVRHIVNGKSPFKNDFNKILGLDAPEALLLSLYLLPKCPCTNTI